MKPIKYIFWEITIIVLCYILYTTWGVTWGITGFLIIAAMFVILNLQMGKFIKKDLETEAEYSRQLSEENERQRQAKEIKDKYIKEIDDIVNQ